MKFSGEVVLLLY